MNDLDQIRAALCAAPDDDLPALVRGLVLHAIHTQRRVSGYRQAISEAFRHDPGHARKVLLRAEALTRDRCKDSTVCCTINSPQKPRD